MMSHYQTYYEERAKSLDSIIEKFKQQTTFEEFVGSVYNPNGGGSCIIGGGSVASVSRSELSSSLVAGAGAGQQEEEPRPRALTGLDADTGHAGHAQLRNRVSVVGVTGHAPTHTGGHYSQVRHFITIHPEDRSLTLQFVNLQIMLNDDSSGSSADKIGPYKTTMTIGSR